MSDKLISRVAPGVTTKYSAGGVLNTVNPLSWEGNYVPQWLVRAFQTKGDVAGNKNAVPSKMAHITAKVATGALTFGIGAWLLRSLMHSMDLDKLSDTGLGGANSSAGGKLDSMYKRPVENPFDAAYEKQQQNEQEYEEGKPQDIKKQAAVGAYQMARGALPLAAVVLAAAGSFKAADSHYDRKLSKKLDQELQKQLQLRAQIAQRRILAARGVPRRKKLAPEATLQKSAGLGQAIGIGAMLLAATAAVAAYNAGKQNDKDTVDYQAYRKGLQEYNKIRASEQVTSSRPIDEKKIRLFNKELDKKDKKKNPRQAVDVSGAQTYRDLLI